MRDEVPTGPARHQPGCWWRWRTRAGRRSAGPPGPCCTPTPTRRGRWSTQTTRSTPTTAGSRSGSTRSSRLQAPVASDLRLVLTALHIAADLERMGDLAAHVAKTCLRRYPAPAVPPELTEVVQEMATGRRRDGREDQPRPHHPQRRPRRPARTRRRRHGRPAPQTVQRSCSAATGPRCGGCGGHGAAGPLLRAVRRPRGQRRPARGLLRHRRIAQVRGRATPTPAVAATGLASSRQAALSAPGWRPRRSPPRRRRRGRGTHRRA